MSAETAFEHYRRIPVASTFGIAFSFVFSFRLALCVYSYIISIVAI